MDDIFPEQPIEDKKKKKAKKGQSKIPTEVLWDLILVALAFSAAALLALTKTILYFGPSKGNIIRGVFSIFIYALSLSGMACAYLAKKKFSIELLLNAGVFIVTLLFL